MISEIIEGYYDIDGKKVSKLSNVIQKYFRPTYPIGRYLSQPLQVNCTNFKEMQYFLKRCSYISDMKQFGKIDYWMPPEDFEAEKKGDCEDFSLWTWRQLINIGYDSRFVIGRAGPYGNGHAWISFTDEEKGYILEPLTAWFCTKFPQLTTVRYEPYFSVSWDGKKVHYYEHKNGSFNPSFLFLIKLIIEWIIFWVKYRPLILFKRMKYRYIRAKNIFSQLFKKEKEISST